MRRESIRYEAENAAVRRIAVDLLTPQRVERIEGVRGYKFITNVYLRGGRTTDMALMDVTGQLRKLPRLRAVDISGLDLTEMQRLYLKTQFPGRIADKVVPTRELIEIGEANKE